MANITRADLRTLIQELTDQQLSVTADQDNWINRGEKRVIRRFMKFFPGLFRSARTEGTTDASGYLSLDVDVERIERIEDDSDPPVKYELIDDINDRNHATGYYVAPYDTTNKKIRLLILRSGEPVAAETFAWYDLALIQMGTGSTTEPVIPENWRDSIATAGAWLFFRSQGPSMATTASYWKGEFLDEMAEAQAFYRRFAKETSYIGSSDPDAGGGRASGRHIVSA